MFKYGRTSQKRKSTLHSDLSKILDEVIKRFDNSVLWGSRGREDQNRMYATNRSKVLWPDGKHNCPVPDPTKDRREWSEDPNGKSRAVDLAPYPIDWGNRGDRGKREKAIRRFVLLAGYMLMAAEMLFAKGEIEHLLIWGGDWDGDNDMADQTFDDLGHYQIYRPKK